MTVNRMAEKFNICFFTSGSVHHYYGGLDRVTEILAEQFENDGHTVFFLSKKNRGKYHEGKQYFLPNDKNLFSSENIKYTADFIDDKDIDFFINQEGNVDLCLPIESKKRPTLITCLHFNPNYIDDNHFKHRYANSNRVLKTMARIIFSIPLSNRLGVKYLRKKLRKNYQKNLSWTDCFVLLSSYFNRPLVDLVGDDPNLYKLESINNPCVMPAYAPNEVDKEKIILYVGRLDNGFKHIDSLIRNVGPLINKSDGWKFIICGDGADRKFLENLAGKISEKIEFKGFCDPTEYYKRASVLLLSSSSSEGWGMVIVEAMNYGVVPVVANTYESLRDIIDDGENGFITQPDDKDFSRHVEMLINDSRLLATMNEKSITKAHSFEVDKITEQWYKLFEKCSSH